MTLPHDNCSKEVPILNKLPPLVWYLDLHVVHILSYATITPVKAGALIFTAGHRIGTKLLQLVRPARFHRNKIVIVL